MGSNWAPSWAATGPTAAHLATRGSGPQMGEKGENMGLGGDLGFEACVS